jgi:APA family basic amino acid/polyamine antiporter
MGISRIVFSMSRNNQLPKLLSKLHSSFGTPYFAILAAGILMGVLALFVNFKQIIELSSFGLLSYYAITNLSALFMKREETGMISHLNRLRALIGLVACVALMIILALSLLTGR